MPPKASKKKKKKAGNCDKRSWQFTYSVGTNENEKTGINEKTCNDTIDFDGDDGCYKPVGEYCNKTKCGFTHCLDDDVEFIQELIKGDASYHNSLGDLVCFDNENMVALGVGNGGSLTWNIAQYPNTKGKGEYNRTADPLFKALAPILGLPLCPCIDEGKKKPINCHYYKTKKPDKWQDRVPVISITAEFDTVVTPHKGIFPGKTEDFCARSTYGKEFNHVTNHWITTLWASDDVPGCSITGRYNFPDVEDNYKVPEVDSTSMYCRTWCGMGGAKGHSIDCTMRDTNHTVKKDAYTTAFFFFNSHLGVELLNCAEIDDSVECNKERTCFWDPRKNEEVPCGKAPMNTFCRRKSRKRLACEKQGCKWNGYRKCRAK